MLLVGEISLVSSYIVLMRSQYRKYQVGCELNILVSLLVFDIS